MIRPGHAHPFTIGSIHLNREPWATLAGLCCVQRKRPYRNRDTFGERYRPQRDQSTAKLVVLLRTNREDRDREQTNGACISNWKQSEAAERISQLVTLPLIWSGQSGRCSKCNVLINVVPKTAFKWHETFYAGILHAMASGSAHSSHNTTFIKYSHSLLCIAFAQLSGCRRARWTHETGARARASAGYCQGCHSPPIDYIVALATHISLGDALRQSRVAVRLPNAKRARARICPHSQTSLIWMHEMFASDCGIVPLHNSKHVHFSVCVEPRRRSFGFFALLFFSGCSLRFLFFCGRLASRTTRTVRAPVLPLQWRTGANWWASWCVHQKQGIADFRRSRETIVAKKNAPDTNLICVFHELVHNNVSRPKRIRNPSRRADSSITSMIYEVASCLRGNHKILGVMISVDTHLSHMASTFMC